MPEVLEQVAETKTAETANAGGTATGTKAEEKTAETKTETKQPEVKTGETAAPKSLLADETATGTKAEEKTGTKTAETKTDDALKLALPENAVITADDLAEIEAFAKAEKLSPAAAQKLVERENANRAAHAEAAKTKQAADYQALFETWGSDLKKDKDFGGEKLPQTLTNAKRALRQFATVEERAFLESTPYGSNPILVRILARTGATLAEDGFVAGAGNPPAAKSPGELHYPAGHDKPSTFR